jgi:hypothetical protein
MLGSSDALAPSLLANGRLPQRVVVAVTEDVPVGLVKVIVSDELPFVPIPLRLTLMAMPNETPDGVSRLVVHPFAVQSPASVRGDTYLTGNVRWLLYPSSWHLNGRAEAFDIPLGVPVSIGLPNDPLNRYMGLGALVANPTDVRVRVSLIWEVLYTDAE